jgi:hypothetical protein
MVQSVMCDVRSHAAAILNFSRTICVTHRTLATFSVPHPWGARNIVR